MKEIEEIKKLLTVLMRNNLIANELQKETCQALEDFTKSVNVTLVISSANEIESQREGLINAANLCYASIGNVIEAIEKNYTNFNFNSEKFRDLLLKEIGSLQTSEETETIN